MKLTQHAGVAAEQHVNFLQNNVSAGFAKRSNEAPGFAQHPVAVIVRHQSM